MFGLFKKKKASAGPITLSFAVDIDRPAEEVYPLIDWADPDNAKKALRPPTYSEIVREAGALTPMVAEAEVVWTSCSSLAHGDTYGALSVLERTIVGTQGRVNPAQITSSPKVLFWAMDRTVAMMQRGFDLFKERATCHR